MNPFIVFAQNECKKLITSTAENATAKLAEVHGGVDKFVLHVVVSIIGYRDFTDAIRIEYLHPTTDLNDVHSMLDTIQVSGGDDIPEDVLGAFLYFLKKSNFPEKNTAEYNHTTNVVILVADAPGHGAFMNGNQIDHYANISSEQEQWISCLGKLRDNNVDLICLQLQKNMTQMVKFIADNYNNGSYKLEHLNKTLEMDSHGIVHGSDLVAAGLLTSSSLACFASYARRTTDHDDST